MEIVNIHDAKTRLSALIAGAVAGRPFVIAKAGRPLVKVEALDGVAPPRRSRLGGMRGQMTIPEDFDTLGQAEIEAMFYGPDFFARFDEPPAR
jgi:antitoxin (DNA-binding transcriptional repressor) of toxin-antitoxin stability system